MSRSIRLALVLFSLALTLTGSALACRTFRGQLDALETQAMLQHQRTVCGVESDFTTACAAARAAASTDDFTTPARIGDSYTRAQQLILGASTPAFALLRDGTVEYSNTGCPAPRSNRPLRTPTRSCCATASCCWPAC